MKAGVEEAIQEALELESGRREGGNPPATIVRWALVAEVLEPGDDHVSLDVVTSDDLPAWQLKGLAWALGRQADDTLTIDE